MVLVQTTLEGARLEVNKTISNMEKLGDTADNLERILLRSMAITRRMGLSEDLSKGIEIMAKAIITAKQLQIALQMAWAATGPWGLAFAVMGGVITGISTVDWIEAEMRMEES